MIFWYDELVVGSLDTCTNRMVAITVADWDFSQRLIARMAMDTTIRPSLSGSSRPMYRKMHMVAVLNDGIFVDL